MTIFKHPNYLVDSIYAKPIGLLSLIVVTTLASVNAMAGDSFIGVLNKLGEAARQAAQQVDHSWQPEEPSLSKGPQRTEENTYSPPSDDVRQSGDIQQQANTSAHEDGKTTLDNLLGAGKQPEQQSPKLDKNGLFSEFEKHYINNANNIGIVLGSRQRVDIFGDELAQVLPQDYAVHPSCVQERRRDSKISGTAQARSIAVDMYAILDQLAPLYSGKESVDSFRERIHWLSQPGSGCPADFPAIKHFLDDFTDFAKSMVERKRESVSAQLVKEQERKYEEIIAADKARALANQKANATAQREAEMFRQKKEAEEKRKSALQSGYAKPNSFNDFMLMHDDYVGGDQYFANPLLKPNNRVYLFSIGGIDRQDGNNLIIKSTTGYIFVRTNHSTPMFGVLQVHSPTVVLGRYVDNTQYTTVLGEIRTAPVIEAIAVTKAQY